MERRHCIVELRLDDATVEPIVSVWQRLAEAGITGVMPSTGARPHVSVVVGADASLSGLERSMAEVCKAEDPLRVQFPYLGLFRGDSNVGFLGVAQTSAIARFQRAVFGAAVPHYGTLDALYRPERVVLHCTMGLEIPEERLCEYFEIVRSCDLPREGLVRALDVVTYFPAETHATIALGRACPP